MFFAYSHNPGKGNLVGHGKMENGNIHAFMVDADNRGLFVVQDDEERSNNEYRLFECK